MINCKIYGKELGITGILKDICKKNNYNLVNNSLQDMENILLCDKLVSYNFQYYCTKLGTATILKNKPYFKNVSIIKKNQFIDFNTLKQYDNQLVFMKPSSNNVYDPNHAQSGKNIIVTTDLLNTIKTERYNKKTNYIIQKGIKHPYLIDGHKTDLRIYIFQVLVNNKLYSYLHEDFFIRLANKKYDENDNDEKIMLTNKSKLTPENKLNSFYTRTSHELESNFKKYILDSVENISIDILNTIFVDENKTNIKAMYQFHHLGLDFIIDVANNNNIILLEINGKNTGTKYLTSEGKNLIDRVLKDMSNVIQDTMNGKKIRLGGFKLISVIDYSLLKKN